MSDVVVDSSRAWTDAKQTYSKLRRVQEEHLHESWFRHMQSYRARALFVNTVLGEIDASYPRKVQRWRTKFDLVMQTSRPQLVLPATATPGLRSLFEQVRRVNRLEDAASRWIQLHSRFTLDVMRLSDNTTRKLNAVRSWFVSIASSWQERVRSDSAAVQEMQQLRQRKSEFLSRLLPNDVDESARCFAESDCMLSVAKLMAVDDEVEKTASQLDCESRDLSCRLTRMQSEQLTSNTVAATKAVRTAFSRSMALLTEEQRQVEQMESARATAAQSIDDAVQTSIASMRALASRAAVESVAASNQVHDLTEFFAKQWSFLKTQVWLPPHAK